MKRKSFDQMECGIAQALELIGDPWSFLIIRDALFGINTFEGFHQNLGIAKNTLTTRLNDMVDSGLMSRHVSEIDKRRTEYILEESGRELWIILIALSQWGNKWAFEDKGPPSYVADRRKQKPVKSLEVKDSSGQPLTLEDIRMIPGPSASRLLKKFFERMP